MMGKDIALNDSAYATVYCRVNDVFCAHKNP